MYTVAAYLLYIRRDSAGVIPGSDDDIVVFFLHNDSVSITIVIAMECGVLPSEKYEGYIRVSLSAISTKHY